MAPGTDGGIDELLEDDRGSVTLGAAAAFLYAKWQERDLEEVKRDAKIYAADKYFRAREYLS